VKHIDPYRVPSRLNALAKSVNDLPLPDEEITLMEVCGTHTMNIHRHGIRSLLPANVRLVSGPGCPVCVTPRISIDTGIAYAREPDVIIASFGDMLRVPGSSSSLLDERAKGSDIKIVYSPLDAVAIARENTDKTVVFMGIGFETTAPAVAQSIIKASENSVENFKVLALGKIIPPAMMLLTNDPRLKIKGFIAAAHVSTIIGMKPYEPIAAKGIPIVIAGFEPADILAGVLGLLKQIIENRSEVENEYSRVVKPDGNPEARKVMNNVFEIDDSEWHGIGSIPKSGLKIRSEYSVFDAEISKPVKVEPTILHKGCRCGEVLMGLIDPVECPLFSKVCTPENPHGACMVSSEGTCAAWFKYRA